MLPNTIQFYFNSSTQFFLKRLHKLNIHNQLPIRVVHPSTSILNAAAMFQFNLDFFTTHSSVFAWYYRQMKIHHFSIPQVPNM